MAKSVSTNTFCISRDSVKKGRINIGIAFPGYNAEKLHLGNKLRLFAIEKSKLETLNLGSFLTKLTDYILITDVEHVPEKVAGHAFFKRVQPKSNNERLARRRAKRKEIDYLQARAHFNGRAESFSSVPFIRMKSHSTGKAYRLMISRQQAENFSMDADFNAYGLSSRSAVPLF